MFLPFCTGKRWGRGRREAKTTSKSPIPWTPSPHGQAESSRLIAGDTSAASDLSSLITRAGVTSARLPYLNSNGVVATSNLLLGHTEDGVGLLAEEQAAVEQRSQAARPWTFKSLFFSNASLIGEDFQRGFTGLYGQGSKESTRTDKSQSVTTCRGHWQWQLVYCAYEDCSVYHKPLGHPPSRPHTAENDESLPDVPVPLTICERVSLTPSLEEELDAKEADKEGEEFPFDAHLEDEDEYENVLRELTAVAARTESPKLITVSRKHGVGDVEARAVSAGLEMKGEPKDEPNDEQRWSTQAQSGCLEAGEEISNQQRAPKASRLCLSGPPSGPPSRPLPPVPTSSVSASPMRLGK